MNSIGVAITGRENNIINTVVIQVSHNKVEGYTETSTKHRRNIKINILRPPQPQLRGSKPVLATLYFT